MKRLNFYQLVLAGLVAMFVLTGCEKETIIGEMDLPEKSRTYLATHFPDQNLVFSVKDRENLGLTYEVSLSGGFMVEFNKKGEAIHVDGNDKKLPESVLQLPIRNYISSKFPDAFAVEWETGISNQQVELSNGLDLGFDKQGNFIRLVD